MKEMKNNNQILYKVRLYKDFEFPSFSINQENRLKDLYHMSLEELYENVKKEDYFELELLHAFPFTLKKEIPILNTRFRQDFNFFIREIVLNELEEKYGKLDYKTNPEIFDKRTRADGSGIDPNSPYHLKTEVEDFFSERVSHYCKILENKII